MSRSRSRGREPEYGSSGRGGAGNIRPQSREPNPNAVPYGQGPGPDDYSHARGRELRNTSDEAPITHSGRGGAGNIRSPSRDPQGERQGYEADKKLVKDYDSHPTIHSSGRGGVGNIDRSRSRDPALKTKTHQGGVIGNLVDRISHDTNDEQHHTTGRGGYGNAHDGGPPDAYKAEHGEEVERNAYKHNVDDAGAHSSGRGGYGNTSTAVGAGGYDTQAPHHDASEHNTYATGRGGVGNIQGGGY